MSNFELNSWLGYKSLKLFGFSLSISLIMNKMPQMTPKSLMRRSRLWKIKNLLIRQTKVTSEETIH